LQDRTQSNEESRAWQILEKIGPLSLIALCIPIAIQIATQPISWGTGISITIILIAMIMGYFLDKRRIELSTKLKEHMAWVEGNKPLLIASAEQGLKRNARLSAFEVVIKILQQEISKGDWTDEQKRALSAFLGKVEAIKEATLFT